MILCMVVCVLVGRDGVFCVCFSNNIIYIIQYGDSMWRGAFRMRAFSEIDTIRRPI